MMSDFLCLFFTEERGWRIIRRSNVAGAIGAEDSGYPCSVILVTLDNSNVYKKRMVSHSLRDLVAALNGCDNFAIVPPDFGPKDKEKAQ